MKESGDQVRQRTLYATTSIGAIEESTRNLSEEKAYPITYNRIPLTDVLATIDRFERTAPRA